MKTKYFNYTKLLPNIISFAKTYSKNFLYFYSKTICLFILSIFKISIRKSLLTFLLLLTTSITNAKPVNLINVYKQAIINDPIWLQASAQNLVDRTGVPISLASLLPSINASLASSLSRTTSSGSAITQTTGSTKGYSLAINLEQTIFDFAKFATLASAINLSQASNANLNAASQDLIIRVTTAYLQVLLDKDDIYYLKISKLAYKRQLDQTQQQYKVGLKTITDVYTAQAAYQSSIASLIGAKNTLANDLENLSIITGRKYTALAKLKATFPLHSPQPKNINMWIAKTKKHNWSILAAKYIAYARKNQIKQQVAGHLPTLKLIGNWENQFARTSREDIIGSSGNTRYKSTSVTLNLNLPLFAGGAIIAKTKKAQHEYETALQNLKFQLRNNIAKTRQSYLNIISSISKIKADKKSIQSNQSALKGMRAGYLVGTETLVNVLNQQQALYQAQTEYSRDRFHYITSLFSLKQVSGSLSIDDIKALNFYLMG